MSNGETVQGTPRVVQWVRGLDVLHLAFFVLFLGLIFLIRIDDPDTFWHLKTGELIWREGALPRGDPFSFTLAGRPWVLHEWLFELMLYGVHSAAGDLGLRLGTSALGTLALYWSYRSAARFVPPIVALVLTLAWLPLMGSWLVPRPQLLTYLLFALFLRWMLDFKYRSSVRGLVLMPPLMALWINAHGAFPLGLVLPLLFLAGERLRLGQGVIPGSIGALRLLRLQWLARILVLGILATLLNPDFIQRWFFPFQLLHMDYANSIIQEWQSPNFHGLYGRTYLLLVGGFVLANCYRRRPPDVTEMLVPLVFIAAGFSALRHVPLAGLVLIPFTARALADSAWMDRFNHYLAQHVDLGPQENGFNWALLGLVLVGAVLLYPLLERKAEARLAREMPVAAADFIQRHDLRGRLFNEFVDGGYLIQRLYPQMKVYVDGRADVYGDDFLRQYQAIRNGGIGWEDAFDRQHIDLLILRRDAPLRALLLMRGDYRLVQEQGMYSLLLHRSESYNAIPAE